ncbi:MAG: hypothetical protein ACK4HD_16050 [Pannonibacter phragmitetus]|uniref:Uncharacterized protein n=1 Tax=Pannonibacter phragmitetus TaxID=121719 RepID=A0A0U3P5W6_9HYPH|nr:MULTISPECIES: hypothetical protein [Pannonibacter]ALV29078.1 hypothetical protein APZ00_20220 [Pannonibacter phragmitetus]SUB00819.1 Uncharacterised protein [Pannonibacter phragmitetus]
MTDKHSKSRQQAETAFGREQSQFFARTRAFEELDAITAARDEKTLRLREARLARELSESLAAAAKSPAKRTKRT